MKIAGFTIGKKHIVVVGILIVFCLIFAKCSSSSAEQRHQEQMALEQQGNGSGDDTDTEEESTDEYVDEDLLEYNLIQQQLIKKWGKPPEGYAWNEDGGLDPLSSDTMSVEDIIYAYIKNVSMLDFSTACKYTSSSVVSSSYQNYYSEDNKGDLDSYSEFVRKVYKLALSSVEIVSIGDTALFEDGSQYVTVNIKGLDLTNKDFWEKDKDELYQNLYKFSNKERDTNKMKTYLYDYIYNSYESGVVPKKDYSIDLVVTKGKNSGWLISDDTPLYKVVSDIDGNSIANYILENFEEYCDTIEY